MNIIHFILKFRLIIIFFTFWGPLMTFSQNNESSNKADLKTFFKHYYDEDYKWVVENKNTFLFHFENNSSRNSENYLRFIYCISLSEFYLKNFVEAKKYIDEIVLYAEIVFGKKSIDFAGIVGNLPQIYILLGEYDKAISLLLMCEKVNEIHPLTEVSILQQLSFIYLKKNNASLAISALEKAILINDTLQNPSLKLKVSLLNELSHSYSILGLKSKTIKYIEEAINITEEKKDLFNDDYYSLMFNLASALSESGNYKSAIEKYDICLNHYLKIKEPTEADRIWLAKSFTFLSDNNYGQAQKCLNSLKCDESSELAYYNYINGIKELYFGKIEKSIKYFNTAKIDLNNQQMIDYSSSINQFLKTAYFKNESYSILDTLIVTDLVSCLNKFENNKFGLADRDVALAKNQLNNNLFYSFNYALQNRRSERKLLQEIYPFWIQINGEIYEQNKRQHNLIINSKNDQIINLFYTINVLKSNTTNEIEIDYLSRELSRKYFQSLYTEKKISSLSLKNVLQKSNEIFLDIISIPKYNFKLNEWTDSSQYLVFISDFKDTLVDYAFIQDGTLMDQDLFDQYKQEATDPERKTDLKSEKFYNSLWKPIADKIGDAKTVYVSLGGVYNNINLNTIYNPTTGRYLLEEKDIRIVNSARDFVLSKEGEKKNYSSNTASLFGFPNFDGNATAIADSSDLITSTRDLNSFWLDSLTRGGLKAKPLPATKTEVENISATLKSKGWQVTNYLADNASETNLKTQQSPRVLHVATHGYFFPDIPMEDKDQTRFLGMDRQQVVQDPMLRSGLLLTGANRTLKGEVSTGENGLLSAAEASLLDLRETELVVLSACETGKGEVKNSEGVYGLRKAFTDAGAQNIIMSLWKVDDKVTQEFMTRFYQLWLNDQSTIREAFHKTQLEIKAKYPQPYYWGAFILVGE